MLCEEDVDVGYVFVIIVMVGFEELVVWVTVE